MWSSIMYEMRAFMFGRLIRFVVNWTTKPHSGFLATLNFFFQTPSLSEVLVLVNLTPSLFNTRQGTSDSRFYEKAQQSHAKENQM